MMNMDYLKNITLFSNEMQKPFQDIMALNVKALRGVKHLRLEELTDLKHPEEFLEKQVNLAIQNSHNMLDYMQKSFQIFENAFLNLSQDFETHSEKMMQITGEDFLNSRKELAQATNTVRKSASTATKKLVKKAVSANKKAMSGAKTASTQRKATGTTKTTGSPQKAASGARVTSSKKKTASATRTTSPHKRTASGTGATTPHQKIASSTKTTSPQKKAMTAKKAGGSNQKAASANKKVMSAASKNTIKSKTGTKMTKPRTANSPKRSSKKV